MKSITYLTALLIFQISLFAQQENSPCSHESIMERHTEQDPNFELELEDTEQVLQKIIQDFKANPQRNTSQYVIPVVMHVFHLGEDGKMGMEQALSGLELLNQDFNGLNDGWDSIDPEFDRIKGTLDITFCLAQIDPQGNPTTGVIYYEDADALLNNGNLFQHAWDNYKYLNIYFPKYTWGAPSDFTAYAYLPSTSGSDANGGGVFYSSVRWGYGAHSILEQDDDWASVCTHEVGHWLNLRHTFLGGCFGAGDLVDDTPPCEGGTIEKEGCNNNDFTCGVHVNGSNFMDYNHRCKKMFTQGQIERMEAALYLPSRITLWSPQNLEETGCSEFFASSTINSEGSSFSIYPNPITDFVTISTSASGSYRLHIYNLQGHLLNSFLENSGEQKIDMSLYDSGVYLFSFISKEKSITKKVVVV